MKLWQKIFLLTLALVIAVVNITSLVLLSNNHNLTVERERQEALSRHNYIAIEMQNRVIYTQLDTRIVTLSEEEVLRVARDVLGRQRSDTALCLSLFLNKGLVSSINQVPALMSIELKLLEEPDFSSLITDAGGSSYLMIVSTVVLNDTPFRLVSSFDITATYELFEEDINLVSVISVVSGLLIAGILLLLIRGLLSPLRNLSTTTRLIAEGDLDKRATVKGHDEVAEVANNFNIMADSIELNVTTLEDVAESRRIFIGNLAHEMKTPLTSILGFADLLRIKRLVTDEERQEYADVIVEETKHLQGLSSTLMELLTTKNVQLTFEPINSVDFAQRLERALSPLFKNTGTTLVIDVEEFSFDADRELFTSLLYNLTDNAVKASSPGDTVTLRIKRLNEGNDGFVVSVEDEGAGIPADQIALLTEPFFMLDKARTRKHGGAGLGLALCVDIVQAHGATLDIESQLDQGTAVKATFPPELLRMPGSEVSRFDESELEDFEFEDAPLENLQSADSELEGGA